MPWWAVARWSWCGRVRDAGTMRGRWHGSVVAERGLHALLVGGSHCQMVRTGFWRQIGSSAQDDKHIGAGARRGARLRDLAYRVSKLFSQHCVRLVALRKPVLWTARAARRPFLFWIGLRARSGCAGPLGPRPLAPPRLCTPRRASGMMAASRGPSGPLRGSPVPSAPGTYTAGWFAPTYEHTRASVRR